MEKFSFKLEVEVEVEAFDEDDAQSLIKDNLGPGAYGSFIDIKKLKIK